MPNVTPFGYPCSPATTTPRNTTTTTTTTSEAPVASTVGFAEGRPASRPGLPTSVAAPATAVPAAARPSLGAALTGQVLQQHVRRHQHHSHQHHHQHHHLHHHFIHRQQHRFSPLNPSPLLSATSGNGRATETTATLRPGSFLSPRTFAIINTVTTSTSGPRDSAAGERQQQRSWDPAEVPVAAPQPSTIPEAAVALIPAPLTNTSVPRTLSPTPRPTATAPALSQILGPRFGAAVASSGGNTYVPSSSSSGSDAEERERRRRRFQASSLVAQRGVGAESDVRRRIQASSRAEELSRRRDRGVSAEEGDDEGARSGDEPDDADEEAGLSTGFVQMVDRNGYTVGADEEPGSPIPERSQLEAWSAEDFDVLRRDLQAFDADDEGQLSSSATAAMDSEGYGVDASEVLVDLDPLSTFASLTTTSWLLPPRPFTASPVPQSRGVVSRPAHLRPQQQTRQTALRRSRSISRHTPTPLLSSRAAWMPVVSSSSSSSSPSVSSSPTRAPQADLVYGFEPETKPQRSPLVDTFSSYMRAGRTFTGTQNLMSTSVPVTGFGAHQEEWEVRVTVNSVDYTKGTIIGLMEALNVPATATTVVTYWEGEIIDFVNHTLWTGKWQADYNTDLQHWRKFDAFRGLNERRINRDFPHLTHIHEQYIFMRWKEQFFVNMTAQDSGLTIAGFYYVCLRRTDGHIEGFYFDPSSTPYQRLTLYPREEGRGVSFPDYSFA